jgi:hypothetical protein
MKQAIMHYIIEIVSAFLHAISDNNIDSFNMKVQASMKMNLIHYAFKRSNSVWK